MEYKEHMTSVEKQHATKGLLLTRHRAC